jgi:hypothetical protein
VVWIFWSCLRCRWFDVDTLFSAVSSHPSRKINSTGDTRIKLHLSHWKLRQQKFLLS